MAAAATPAPGTEYGPCIEACAHRAPYLGHGDAWSECPEITPAEWAAREREAARLLAA